MIYAILACGLLALTFADGTTDPHHFLASGKYDDSHWTDNPGCGVMERMKVRHQWYQAYLGHGRQMKWEFARTLFRTLGNVMPEFPAFYDRIHNGSLESKLAQYGRLIGYFNMAYMMLDEPEIMNAHFHYLRTRHLTVRFCPEDTPVKEIFVNLRTAVLALVPAALGRCYDEKAWTACTNAVFQGFGGKLSGTDH